MQPGGPIKVIITGVTGMVGEGVMHECLQHPAISEVLVINRKASGFTHPKLKEILHKDFFNIAPVEQQLAGYDACFFCLGVTSLGKKEAEYYDLTYTLTITFAETLCRVNNNLVFCYISGASTDSTEKGRVMWARVKGKTENDLMKMPFTMVYNFRPGY
ncbi:MAG TPA: NAD-dependent epimerase/dehydratase family protein, partial [Chitinophagaceae bacterium]|nr:NAD-dependent epimerase/dehydratase family protein [Chitinophagaceae bacterium]